MTREEAIGEALERLHTCYLDSAAWPDFLDAWRRCAGADRLSETAAGQTGDPVFTCPQPGGSLFRRVFLRDTGTFNEDDHAAVALVGRHLARYLAAGRTADTCDPDTAALLAAAAIPVALCDGEGRLTLSNAAMQAFLSAGASPLAIIGGRLTVLDGALAANFAAALAADGYAEVLLRRDGAPEVLLAVRPLSSLRLVVALDNREPADAGRFHRRTALLFGLTAAESEVALAAALGHAPTQIAAARGSALDTIRTQLKMVYGKTGLAGQAELIRLANLI